MTLIIKTNRLYAQGEPPINIGRAMPTEETFERATIRCRMETPRHSGAHKRATLYSYMICCLTQWESALVPSRNTLAVRTRSLAADARPLAYLPCLQADIPMMSCNKTRFI
jgi:hypothetical protein